MSPEPTPSEDDAALRPGVKVSRLKDGNYTWTIYAATPEEAERVDEDLLERFHTS